LLATEIVLVEEANEILSREDKVRKSASGHPMPNPYVAIKNQALKNIQSMTKLLNNSKMANSENTVAKVAKLDLLKNGKNKIQKTGS